MRMRGETNPETAPMAKQAMSKQNQTENRGPRAAAPEAESYHCRIRASGITFKKRPQLLAGWLVLGMAALASCSDGQTRRENSELRADPPAAPDTPVPAAPAANANTEAAEVPAGVLSGAGRRYRVVVETAYFFDQPELATPNGRYLRRGDTFYGEGETNGFVKASFKQPNGVVGTGWLKVQGLGKLAGRAAAASSPRVLPPSRAAAAPAPSDYQSDEAADAASEPTSAASAGRSQTAVVRVARSYFYRAADLATPRKAFCQRGDKVRLLQTRGAAVYVTFTNWEKVTTTGWMRQDALR